ncbi:hypothetical protein MLOOGBEN_03430 [Bacillus sp. EB106-08-02-XG196]|nr:hypothetical protein [Bacillus sp. EB106-08-02-XG196]NWQ39744.1 hypothetical protein [Bacillus sp. EB106-08-02-XG196]
MGKKQLGHFMLSGVTEEHGEKAIGSLQIVWSDRRAWGKGNWVTPGCLE